MTVAACTGCGVEVTRDDEASAWMRQEVWYDADVVDMDVPGTACPGFDGDPHETAVRTPSPTDSGRRS